MICFVIISSIFLFGLAARILGSIGKALNAAIGVERYEIEEIPPIEKPPSVPVPEAVKKKATKRSDLNGPTDHADKPAGPDKSSVPVQAPSKPKATFGGMRAGFLLSTPKKPQPKETTAKADTPKTGQTPGDQQPKAGQLNVNTSPDQTDPPRTTKAGQTTTRQDPPRPTTEARPTHQDPPRARPTTGAGPTHQDPPRPSAEARPTHQDPSAMPAIPIYPVLAQVRPILLPVPGTNQATLIWDGSQRAQFFLQMIVAARKAAGL